MKRKAHRGYSKKREEGRANKREEKDVMGQIDEIGWVADKRRDTFVGRWKDSICQTEYSNGSNQTEAEHEGGESRGVVGQQHRYCKYDGKSIGRPFESDEGFYQIHLSETDEGSEGKEINGIGRETRDEGADAREIENSQRSHQPTAQLPD